MVSIELELPDDFLLEENRNGYLVTKKMKEVWAIELDLLNKFLQVCKKYNLEYFAESGTLLGAIRHKGFIPWDDDIDIVMFREDYIKLCEVAEKEFHNPYFFQTEFTDPGSVRGHIQIRNSLTTGIRNVEFNEECRFNQGIFIDIFPMDKIPNNSNKVDFFRRLKYMQTKMIEFSIENYRKKCSTEKNPYFQEFEELCQRYNCNSKAVQIGAIEYSCDRSDMIRNVEDYKDFVEVDFEFLKIRVPIGYRRVLTEQYGNWNECIVGNSGHGDVFFDTDVPYIKYIGG